MPDTATLEEAPLTADTTPIPGAEMPEGLKNLLDRVLPVESGEEPSPAEQVEGEADSTPEPKPKAEEKKPEPAAKKESVSRLAPDILLEKKDKPEVEASEPEMQITEEMIKNAKTPKAQADLRKFGTALDNYVKENAQLKAKLATAAVPAEDVGAKERIAQLEQTNKDLLARVERVDLMASPKFQEKYVLPRNKMYAEAQNLLKEVGLEPEQLERAMGLVGKAKIGVLDEILEAIPSQAMRDRFGRLMDGIDEKNREMGEQLKNARANNEQLTRQEKIAQHETFKKQEADLKTMLSMARRDLAENAKIPVFHKTGLKEYAWWDKQVDEIDALAEDFLLRATPDILGKIAYGAAIVDPLLDMFHAERKARVAAEERLAAVEGAEPGLGEDKRNLNGEAVPDDADVKTAVFARLRSGRA